MATQNLHHDQDTLEQQNILPIPPIGCRDVGSHRNTAITADAFHQIYLSNSTQILFCDHVANASKHHACRDALWYSGPLILCPLVFWLQNTSKYAECIYAGIS